MSNPPPGMNNESIRSKPRQTGMWRNVRRWLPGVLISLIAIFAVLKFAGTWQDVRDSFREIQLKYVGACAVLTIVFLLIRANGWRILLGKKATVSQAFWVINQGYLLNNLFPLRAGEIGRAIFMGKAINESPFFVLSTIVIERAFDLAIAAGLLLSTLPLVLGAEWARQAAWVTLAIVASGLLVLFVMARNPRKVQDLVSKIGGRFSLINNYIIPQINHLLDGLKILSNPWQFLWFLFWICLSWGVAVTSYYVMLLSIAPDAPFWWGVFTDAMLAAGIAIPSAPGAIGVFEAAIVFALSLLGLKESLGLAYAVVLHFLQAIMTGVLGIIGLAQQGKSLRNIANDLQMERQTSPSEQTQS